MVCESRELLRAGKGQILVRRLETVSENLNDLAELFKSIGNEYRLKILFTLALKGPTSFSDLSDELNISGGKLNFHLRKLRDLGVVVATESGAYELTEKGRWIVARVSEFASKTVETAPLVDFRGLPYPSASVSEIARKLNCGKELSELESFLERLFAKLSSIQREGVRGEVLALLAEVMFCDREPSVIGIPRSLSVLAFKSLADEGCAHLRESILQDLALSYAVEKISPTFKSYQCKGLIYVRNPAWSIRGAQVVVLTVPRGVELGRIMSKLIDTVSELVLVFEELRIEELEMLHGLIPPGKVTLVVRDPPEREIPAHGLGFVYQIGEDSDLPRDVVNFANSAVPLIVNRCESVPSLSLAELPLPEPGEAYVLPLQVALSLPSLYAEVKSKGLDGYHFITLVAEESGRVSQNLRAPAVRRALKGVVDNIVELEPQLALVGFEASMLLHHRQLHTHRLLELAKRFWSTVIRGLPVKITAALADERVYLLSRVPGFNALSPFSLSSQRTLDELAMLEGAVQQLLRGGSVLAIKVKGYLTSQLLDRVASIVKSSGVLRVSFHLEFTRCSLCSTMSVGRSSICSTCLSGEVTQLIRPLGFYVPPQTVPPEVLTEYESRLSLS
ncbi:MAG: ArsR family transcriptional regulator [Thermofilaceae archaeon]